jgi:hypothetical protein
MWRNGHNYHGRRAPESLGLGQVGVELAQFHAYIRPHRH